MHRRKAFVVLCGTLAVAGCRDQDASSEAAPSKAVAAATAMADGEPSDDGPTEAMGDKQKDDAEVVSRKLIQTAELHVQVASYAQARSEIEKNLSEMGGFIADASVQHSDGDVSHADLTVRIPSERLGEFLAGTAGHGDVLHETVKSKDITEGYYDVKARLKNAKRLEARLLALLDANADTVSSLLEVERELARVRGQIEGFEGKIRLWDNQVSLSTVKLRLVTRQVYAVTQPPTVTDRMDSALSGSIAALKGAGLGVLLLLVALLPWLLPLAAVGWVVRALVKRFRKPRPIATPPAHAQPGG